MIASLTVVFAAMPWPCVDLSWRAAGRPSADFDVTSEIYPIKVHFQRPEDSAKADTVLEATELAWAVQVDELGFRAPVLPDGKDGPQFDIYLDRFPTFQGYAAVDWWKDAESGDGYMGASAYVVLSRDLPTRYIDSYMAHEFNHVLQWGTDFTEPTLPVWEGMATAAQHWTLDIDDWVDEVPGFQDAPWAPALVGDSYEVWDRWGAGYTYEYGSALWVMHLDQLLLDGDGTGGAELWDALAQEGWVNEPDVVDAIQVVSGQNLPTFMNGLARTRLLVADDWDDRGLPGADGWGASEKVVRVERTVHPGQPIDIVFDPPLQITGQGFVELDIDQADELTLMVRGDDEFALVLFWWSEQEVGEVVAQDSTVTLDVSDKTRVVAALTNLGAEGWDGDDDAYVDGDQVLRVLLSHSKANPTPEREEVAVASTCSCQHGPTSPWGLLLVALFARYQRTGVSRYTPNTPRKA